MNYNVLPIYTSLEQQDRYKSYSDGHSYPLRCGKALLPFQIPTASTSPVVMFISVVYSDGTVASFFSTNCALVDGHYTAVFKADRIQDLVIGDAHLEVHVGGTTYYSEQFTIVDDIYECLKLTWWDKDNFSDGDMAVYYGDNYRNFFYIAEPLGKPSYSYEDVSTTRDGIPYPDKRILKKTYRTQFCCSEAVLDALCMARLADYIVLYDGETRYGIADLTITPNWTSQPNVASVTMEMVCADSVVKKIAKTLTEADMADFNTDYNNDYLIES